MTVDRTRGRATNQSAAMERKHTNGMNVEQNNSGMQTSSKNNHPSRKPPMNGREVYEMWKARALARAEMCSQECKVQGVPQNRTLP